MQIHNKTRLFSASDLVNFLECPHLTALDLQNLETPLLKAEDDEQAKLLQDKGFAHEAAYLEGLRRNGADVSDLKDVDGSIEDTFEATRKGMADGRKVIFQACFYSPPFVGHADFLRRVPVSSGLESFGYEVVDTKLARRAKAKFIIQLCLYSDLLAEVQEFLPNRIHVVLGDGTEQSFRLANYLRYYRTVKARFLECVGEVHGDTYPAPCTHCGLCHWRDLCNERWEKDDHLNQVANMTQIQIKKLNAGGIRTLAGLAQLDANQGVPGMRPAIFDRLRRQAALQLAKRETGEDRLELLEADPYGIRGFHRLPEPDIGDLFFDMEGDPLEEGGLEYLFGVYCYEDSGARFIPFWAHDRQQEGEAFGAFMGFVMNRLKRYPGMHIYHYAHYEETALKRLMSLHSTCEAEVDHLLRTGRLVDLYKVVREAVMVSEPRYSIKNLETFYMGKREGEVKDAGASIVYYERWKETGDSKLLDQIRDYNEDDCVSTYLLREWLLTIRPTGIPWFVRVPDEDSEEKKSENIHEAEARLVEYREKLLGSLPPDKAHWDGKAHTRELVFQLLDFHRRAAKPQWWAMFNRQEMTEEELIDDPECIGAIKADPEQPPQAVKRSIVYTFRYPEQEFKLKPGEHCLRAETLEPAGNIEEIDESERLVRLKLWTKYSPLPDRLSIIPTGPIRTGVLKEALYRFADSIISGSARYSALEAFLQREPPSIEGLPFGATIITDSSDLIEQATDAVRRLRKSHLFIQGPPGAGKTYTGAHIIVSLLDRGFRVGVSSNSHKAINNLLGAVEKRAVEKGLRFQGAKKSTQMNPETCFGGDIIEDVFQKDAISPEEYQLIAGTAWLFADPGFDQTLDYLFVDEAGQVALANLIAMGTCARNLVLLGDQMQLQQPIQGVHPGYSGESALDYLLQGQATIADDRGIFLDTTWRMHEEVCRFISDAVYDGRLHPETDNQNQRLLLRSNAHPDLRLAGIRLVKADHDGCSQRSQEEAEIVRDLYTSLLEQSYSDRNGKEYPMSPDDILVVAPYNMQVNLLKQTLQEGARVGTVDKFQGQEAEVVVISMATSSGDYLPRHMEFLYSKNRLNVAISRARCLAILVANPALMAIRCHTVEQVELVNTLCWVEEYSAG